MPISDGVPHKWTVKGSWLKENLGFTFKLVMFKSCILIGKFLINLTQPNLSDGVLLKWTVKVSWLKENLGFAIQVAAKRSLKHQVMK